MEKTCLNCGRTFKGSKRRKYCCFDCYLKHYWKMKYQRYKRMGYVELEPKVFLLPPKKKEGYYIYTVEALEHVKPWRLTSFCDWRRLSIDEVKEALAYIEEIRDKKGTSKNRTS